MFLEHNYVCVYYDGTICYINVFSNPFIMDKQLFIESINLIPFRDLRLNYEVIREIILNIIMMVPFGFYTPLLRRKVF